VGYCTGTQVAAEAKLGSGFTAAASANPTSPTSERVDEIIAEVSADIDAQLGMRYATPITDATDLLTIRQIATILVAERVVGTIEVTTQQGVSAINPKMKDANLMRQKLADIVAGKFKLNTAEGANPVRSYMVDNDKTPLFKRDCEQW
jgi:phage gp36-like protein